MRSLNNSCLLYTLPHSNNGMFPRVIKFSPFKLFENWRESMIKPDDGIIVCSIVEFICFVKNVDSGFHIFHQY